MPCCGRFDSELARVAYAWVEGERLVYEMASPHQASL